MRKTPLEYEEIRAFCNSLADQGKAVTNRGIHEKFGGSLSTIHRLLGRWHNEQTRARLLEQKDISFELRDAIMAEMETIVKRTTRVYSDELEKHRQREEETYRVLEASENERIAVQETLTATRQENDSLQEKIVLMQQRIEHLNEERGQLQQRIEQTRADHAHAEGRLSGLERVLEKNEQDIVALRETVTSQGTVIEQERQRTVQLTTEKSEAVAQVLVFKGQLEKSEKEKEKLAKQVQQVQGSAFNEREGWTTEQREKEQICQNNLDSLQKKVTQQQEKIRELQGREKEQQAEVELFPQPAEQQDSAPDTLPQRTTESTEQPSKKRKRRSSGMS